MGAIPTSFLSLSIRLDSIRLEATAIFVTCKTIAPKSKIPLSLARGRASYYPQSLELKVDESAIEPREAGHEMLEGGSGL